MNFASIYRKNYPHELSDKCIPTCLVFQSVANMEDQNNIIEPEENNFSLFEDICLRIPYLGEKILRHLDDKSLSNLKLSCKSICAFMQYQRWFWIRIIQRYIGKIEDVDETWQTAIDKGQLISQHIFPDISCQKENENLFRNC